MRRYLIAFVSLATVPALTLAQGRGGVSGGGHASGFAAAPHAAAHSAAPMATHSTPIGRTPYGSSLVRTHSGSLMIRPLPRPSGSVRATNSGRRVQSQDVPGLGFDYAHLAAVGGGRGRGHRPGRNFRRPYVAYFPFFGGGYYMPIFDDYDDYYDDSGNAGASDQYADTIGPDDYYPPGPPPPRYSADQNYPPAPIPAAEPVPARPADEYVFVRRDGTLFFAIAYSWDKGTLSYVTGDGVRRSVAGSALDLVATQQFNEQRGLRFSSPA